MKCVLTMFKNYNAYNNPLKKIKFYFNKNKILFNKL